MLEAAGVEAIRKLGERAMSSAAEVNLQGEMARQMAQQEAFRVGELSGVELNDLGGLRARESAAAEDIRDALGEGEDRHNGMRLDAHPEGEEINQADAATEAQNEERHAADARTEWIEGEEINTREGDAYGELSNREGYEKHHMPADSTTPLDYEEGPCIQMETADHRQTASWGNSREAQDYRQEQRDLVEQGKFREAFDMDVRDIRDKFGSKYDNAIAQAEKYVSELQARGRTP